MWGSEISYICIDVLTGIYGRLLHEEWHTSIRLDCYIISVLLKCDTFHVAVCRRCKDVVVDIHYKLPCQPIKVLCGGRMEPEAVSGSPRRRPWFVLPVVCVLERLLCVIICESCWTSPFLPPFFSPSLCLSFYGCFVSGFNPRTGRSKEW